MGHFILGLLLGGFALGGIVVFIGIATDDFSKYNKRRKR